MRTATISDLHLLGDATMLSEPSPPCPMPPSKSSTNASKALTGIIDLWNRASESRHSTRDYLYDFLGTTHQHAAAFERDEEMREELVNTLRDLYRTQKRKRTLSKKPIQELLLLVAMRDHRPSLRSKYKTLLLRACKENVPPNRESFKVWLKASCGMVKTLVGTSKRDDKISAVRCHLLTRREPRLGSISTIDNSPPKDTFVVAIYREEAGQLIPCFATDDPRYVNMTLRNLIRGGNSELVLPKDTSNGEAAMRRLEIITREAA